jgi:hypothetical protein
MRPVARPPAAPAAGLAPNAGAQRRRPSRRAARTCSMPLSAQQAQNQVRPVPKPNAMLTMAVAMRPPASSTVGENLAPSTPLMNLDMPYAMGNTEVMAPAARRGGRRRVRRRRAGRWVQRAARRPAAQAGQPRSGAAVQAQRCWGQSPTDLRDVHAQPRVRHHDGRRVGERVAGEVVARVAARRGGGGQGEGGPGVAGRPVGRAAGCSTAAGLAGCWGPACAALTR